MKNKDFVYSIIHLKHKKLNQVDLEVENELNFFVCSPKLRHF